MNLVQNLLIITCFLALVALAYKTDTWPPPELIKHYEIEKIVRTCYDKCGTQTEDLILLENSTDISQLQNKTEVKCFVNCSMVESETVEPNSTRLTPVKFLDIMTELTNEEQKIFMTMSRGCLTKTRYIRDPIEFTYALALCTKANDNEHFYMYY